MIRVHKIGEQVTSFLQDAKKQKKSVESFSSLTTYGEVPEPLVSEVVRARQIKESYAPLINSFSRSDTIKTKFKRRFNAGFETVLLNLDKVTKLHNELTTATPAINHNPKYSMKHLEEIKSHLSQFVAFTVTELSRLTWFTDKVKDWINTGAHIGRRAKGGSFDHETKDLLYVALNCRQVMALAAGAKPKPQHATTTLIQAPRRR